MTEIPSEYVTETELNAKGYLTSYTETDPTVPAWAKAATKPTYTASEVGALPADTVIPTVPTKVSAFTNDAGYLTQHQSLAGYATETYANTAVSNHNTNTSAHNDIRLLIEGLTTRLNTLADSDDTTLDQMSEIVAYIKNNKSLIEGVTTNKVNVSDIINNLTTNIANKPLSAAQGVALKELIDAIPGWAKQSTKPSYTKSEVGLGNVDNTSDANKPVSTVQATAIADAKKAGTDVQNNLNTHTSNKSNPHSVTKAQVGLSNVDNVKQYSASNPPPYPVTSVNGKTGNIQLTAENINAPSVLEVAKYITPEMYGAKGDGTTDDSAAIQAAIDAAGRSATIYLAKKEYKISTGITITKNRAHFVCDGILRYDGTGAALKLESIALCDINVYAIEAPNGTALLLDSTNGEIGASTICVRHVLESRIGVHLKGSLGGATAASGHNIFYNKITMEGTIHSTDTCVFIEAIDALVSENIFRLGRLYGGALYGIRIHCNDIDGGTQVVGHGARNMFYGGNFEGLSDDGCSIYLHNTSHNTFVNWRTFEAYGKYTVVFSGVCEANDINLSRIALSEIDTTNLTGTGVYKNILRSPCIAGDNTNNLSGLNKIWLSFEEGFTSEYSDIEKKLHSETWVFTLSDGTVIEKQVNVT